MERICLYCKWRDDMDRCRKRAPVAVEVKPGGRCYVRSAWPAVVQDDFCGEFEADRDESDGVRV